MKTRSTSLSSNVSTHIIERVKKKLRKKLKKPLAEALVELLVTVNNDYNTSDTKRKIELSRLIDQINTFANNNKSRSYCK